MKFSLDLSALPIDPDFLKRHEQEFRKLLDQEMLKTRARIIASDTAGQQAEGGGLKPYSSSYRAAIDKGQVAGKEPGNHTPNLTATGVLHRSLTIEQGSGLGEVRMFFNGSHPPRQKVQHPQKRVKAAHKRREKQGLAPLAPHKHARAAKGAGKTLGKGAAPAKRRSGGGRGSTQNAVIAQAQYDMGRTGWFTFSTEDLERIQRKLGDLVARLFFK
ncbi:hypothetical protein EP7_004328 [Isosphaeraceae bacterium EP7]